MPIVRTTRITDSNGQARMILPNGPQRALTEVEGALFEAGDHVVIQVDGANGVQVYTDEKDGINPIMPSATFGPGVEVIFEHRDQFGRAIVGEQVTFVTEN